MENQPKESIAVTDLQMFVELLTIWHTRKVNILKHLMDVPQGMEVAIGDDEHLLLDGDAYRAFILGINLSLKELGTLPFTSITEDAPQQTVPAHDAAT